MLILYHAGLTQASIKVRLTLKEKGLAYESRFIRLMEQEHLSPEYLAINPDGQVPTLVHDGNVITETTVINEYLEDCFPEPPLRPADPVERARMRGWGQLVDEHLFHAMATLAWHQGVGPVLRKKDNVEIDRALARLPLPSKRQKWLKAVRAGFTAEELSNARDEIAFSLARMERALTAHTYLAGPAYSLADINVLSSVQRMPRWASDLMNATATPRVFTWLQRMLARPAVHETLSVSDEAPPLPPDAAAATPQL